MNTPRTFPGCPAFCRSRGAIALLAALLAQAGCGDGGRSASPGADGSTGGNDAAASDAGWTAPDVGTAVEAGDPGAADVTFEVNAQQGVRPISPLIYGWNNAEGIATNRQTVVRSGGNRWTAYNWETNASNAGSDWLFQNDSHLSDSDVPGQALRPSIETATQNGAAALVTVPIVDYVAADKLGGGDVRSSGADYLTTRFKQNRPAKGAAFTTTPDASDAFVYQDEFVSWAKGAFTSSRILFSLDNEPDLWSHTHAEVHPDPVTYAELVRRNTDYATAIKAVWPSAEVTGFVSYGWAGYVSLQSAPDAAANGEFLEYYLTNMKQAETAAGERLIDYLDLHWYPEARGGAGEGVRITEDNTTPEVVAARVQAPRSLWDRTYTETSWISQWGTSGPIYLIPRLMEKIERLYPGTKLAFTEYNFGAGGHISGAVATADALGVFGREGVSMACVWPMGTNTYALAALRAFRNFDGAGGQFGDTSIGATSSDVATATVYASVESANPSRLVLIAINKATAAKTAGVRLAHSTTYRTLKVFTLTDAGPTLQAGADVPAAATNAFLYTMPALSVSVLVPQP